MNERYTILICFNDFLDALKHKDYLYDNDGKIVCDKGYKNTLYQNIKYCIGRQCDIIKNIQDNQKELDKQIEILLYMKMEVKELKL